VIDLGAAAAQVDNPLALITYAAAVVFWWLFSEGDGDW
jgi:hypothetical protein